LNLIIGGDSVIGRTLAEYWSNSNIPFHASTRHNKMVSENCPIIDLNNTDTFQNLKTYNSAIICAAFTEIAECEKKPVLTRKTNVVGTVKLVKRLLENGTHVVFLSSNAVFDGQHPMQNPNATRAPITEYGRQKAEAERLILQMPRSAVLRLTKVVHSGLPLIKQWESNLQAGQPIEAFVDMNIAPIFLEEVVQRIDKLIRNRETGIFHLSGKRDVSYYEFAKNYFKSIPNVELLIQKSYMRNS
jgi:dTDP-4-dehydrorhamnose reductase